MFTEKKRWEGEEGEEKRNFWVCTRDEELSMPPHSFFFSPYRCWRFQYEVGIWVSVDFTCVPLARYSLRLCYELLLSLQLDDFRFSNCFTFSFFLTWAVCCCSLKRQQKLARFFVWLFFFSRARFIHNSHIVFMIFSSPMWLVSLLVNDLNELSWEFCFSTLWIALSRCDIISVSCSGEFSSLKFSTHNTRESLVQSSRSFPLLKEWEGKLSTNEIFSWKMRFGKTSGKTHRKKTFPMLCNARCSHFFFVCFGCFVRV